MATVSFALYEAFAKCGSVDVLATRLGLPSKYVAERVEAARLIFVLTGHEAA
jgi:hypothetical protein